MRFKVLLIEINTCLYSLFWPPESIFFENVNKIVVYISKTCSKWAFLVVKNMKKSIFRVFQSAIWGTFDWLKYMFLQLILTVWIYIFRKCKQNFCLHKRNMLKMAIFSGQKPEKVDFSWFSKCDLRYFWLTKIHVYIAYFDRQNLYFPKM